MSFSPSIWAQESTNETLKERETSYYTQGLAALALGDRVLALNRFQLAIVHEPNNAGAWLDLALLYCEDGAIAQAEQTFRALESRFPLPEAIRQMIAYQRMRGCQAPIPKITPSYTASAQLVTGYASNVNAAPSISLVRFGPLSSISFLELSSESQPKADKFLSIGLQAIGHLGLVPRDQWLASIDSRTHGRYSSFDTTHILVGYSVPLELKHPLKPTVSVTGSLSNWWLKYRQHETTEKLSVDGWLPALKSNDVSARLGLTLSVSHTLYQENSSFNSQRNELLMRGEVVSKNWAGLAFLGPITDVALNERPGGGRSGLLGGLVLSNKWRFGSTQLTLASQLQRDSLVYNELLFPGVERTGRRFFATLRHEGDLGNFLPTLVGLKGLISLTSERNKDSLDFFSYKNQILMIGLRGQW